jgi:ketosteroid isomerase-like protein
VVTPDDVVDTYIRASETADVELMRSILADGAVLWHNFDEVERDLVAGLEHMPKMHERFADIAFETLERHTIPGGVVIRQILRATVRETGVPFASHMCKFLRITDGKLTRIDEYVAPS